MKKQLVLMMVAGLMGCMFWTQGMVLAGSLDAFKNEKGTIKVAGGTAHIPVMKEAAKQIMTVNSDIQITIAGGGSGVGIKQVGEGLVDIGNSGRKPTDEEIAKYGLKPVQWAIDGVAIVINPKNIIRKLTGTQVKDIFAGKIDNWKQVGGEDKAVSLYTRDEASGTREVFWEKGLGKGEISSKANVVVSNGAMKTAVAQDPYAIGYVSVGHLDQSVAPVSFDGVEPTLESVKSGKYPIARGLYSMTKGEPKGLAKKLIGFLFSPEGQKIISEKGFIPVQ
ncbi:MAG: phosphate-binding protein [Desulfobacterales bacterium CG07_land_8_20_14_0_80_52_14]|nr:MAG: phosphate-binding protein [Desulfobacterales bacterium CG23_combo_of_CG06-09_8_20_14_all_52_9]PIU50673.1 MAG: phosphate-binding protein [Desulfobacterales bacterium CG07_land_8_20_14_0_80_52_14]